MDVKKTDSARDTATVRRRPRNPYPGLRSFEDHESRIFFGRDRHIDEILERLADSHFVPVIGPSGCGKSSLIRAGVVPALRAGRYYDAGSRWHIAVTRPENSPIWNLASALYGLTSSEGDEIDYDQIRLLVSMLLGDDDGIEQFHKQSNLGKDENILIVIDQFEELFNIENEAQLDAAEALISIILNIHEAKFERIHCIVTMRTDNLGDCARFTGLADAINRTLYLTPNLTEAELREVIELPAIRFGGTLEDGLLDRILRDMTNEIDQLPLMQHVMWRIWATLEKKKSKNRVFSHQLYESFGCIADTVNHHARELVDELETAQRALVPGLFRQLTERRVGGVHQDVRRPTLFKDIAFILNLETDQEKSLLRSVVDHFRAHLALFLRPQKREHARIDDDTNIDIVHECLIRKWDDLKDWVEQEWKSARDLRDLDRQAVRFETVADERPTADQEAVPAQGAASRDGTAMPRGALVGRILGRGQRAYLDKHLTNELSRWQRTENPNGAWAARYGFSPGRFERAMEFLEFSKKKHRFRKFASASAFATLFLAIVFGPIAWLDQAREQRRVSIYRAANKLGLTAQMLSPNMTQNALKLWSEELNSVEGELETITKSYPKLEPWVSAQRALQEESLNLMLIPRGPERHSDVFTRERGVLHFDGKPVLDVKDSPDGEHWAILHRGGLTLIDRAGRKVTSGDWKFKLTGNWPPDKGPTVSFYPNGKHVHVIQDDREVLQIDLGDTNGISKKILSAAVEKTAVSADGSRLVIARPIEDDRYLIEFIDLLSHKRVAAFRTAQSFGKLNAISYNAGDHSLLALAFEESDATGTQLTTPITLWHIPDEGEPDLSPAIEFRTPVTGIERIELSPDGNWLAAESVINGHLWNLSDIPEFKGPNSSLYGYSLPIKELKFLQHGEILTMRHNGETHIWRYDGMLSSRRLIHGPEMPMHVALNVSNARLSVVEDDGNFLHWNLKKSTSSQAEVVRLKNYAKQVTVSDDASVIAAGYQNGELELLAPKLEETGRIKLSAYTLTGGEGDKTGKDRSPVVSLSISKDGGTVVALRQNGVLITALRRSDDGDVFDVTTNEIGTAAEHGAASVSLSPDGNHLVALTGGQLRKYMRSSDQRGPVWLDGADQAKLSFGESICAFAYSPDGGYISAGTENGKILVAPLTNGVVGKSWSQIRSFKNNTVSSLSFGTSAGSLIISSVLSERHKNAKRCSRNLGSGNRRTPGDQSPTQNRLVELTVSQLDGTPVPRRRSNEMSLETRELQYRGTSFLPDGDTMVLTDVGVRNNSAFIRFFDLFPARETSTDIVETIRGQIETRDYIDIRRSNANEQSGARFDDYFPAKVGCGQICWMIAPTGIKNRLLVFAFQHLRPLVSGKQN